ncbi:uncharacterized protein [Venturia canescens]|uniref:uncharacterized protein n=1 Tax=Venturia canescens TaxID=32260 RepID=UPI001C9C3AFE|nr:uncharacterized protein LOC122412010 [Venturia canescens]
MSYVQIENISRTDQEYFLELDDDDHHHVAESPISHFPMGPVSQVPFDVMHLLDLGLMKRLFIAWIEGKFSRAAKLCGRDIILISERLKYLYDWCPSEFARFPRSWERYGRWKATEFRQFLLYSGPVVPYGILPTDLYNHFLLLSSAARILVSSNPSRRQLTYARMTLKIFVAESVRLYGHNFASYNVHGLLHLVDDVEIFGPADGYSAYPYENAMQYFRRCIRKPHLSLQQIANRRSERARLVGSRPHRSCDGAPITLDRHHDGPLSRDAVEDDVLQFRRLKSKKISLSIKKRNRYCVLKDSRICRVENIIRYQNNICLVARIFESVESFFDVGVPSNDVGFFKCKTLSKVKIPVTFNDILAKCYAMPLWAPRCMDEYGRELLVDGTFIVAAMNVVSTY